MLLSDQAIIAALETDQLTITPSLDTEQIQPASIDLTLGDSVRYFNHANIPAIDLHDPPPVDDVSTVVTIDTDSGYTLQPGEFILGETVESIQLGRQLGGFMTGRSTLGRLGLTVHATAAWFDPGFKGGSAVLEIANVGKMPITIYPGDRIVQLLLFALESPAIAGYGERPNKYQDQDGPAAANIAKFEGK